MKQKRFFEDYIIGEKGTILTLKAVGNEPRGFSLNIRGPFKLAVYNFPTQSETVIDPEWAGDQESNSHMHCCWMDVQFAKLSRTNEAVKKSIGYKWQLSFFASQHAAVNNHKAVQKLQEGQVTPVT